MSAGLSTLCARPPVTALPPSHVHVQGRGGRELAAAVLGHAAAAARAGWPARPAAARGAVKRCALCMRLANSVKLEVKAAGGLARCLHATLLTKTREPAGARAKPRAMAARLCVIFVADCKRCSPLQGEYSVWVSSKALVALHDIAAMDRGVRDMQSLHQRQARAEGRGRWGWRHPGSFLPFYTRSLFADSPRSRRRSRSLLWRSASRPRSAPVSLKIYARLQACVKGALSQ